MSPMLLDEPMAKKKGVSVQIDEDVVKSARVVSSLSDEPISALISGILRPILAQRERALLEERAKSLARPAAPPPRPAGPPRKGGGK